MDAICEKFTQLNVKEIYNFNDENDIIEVVTRVFNDPDYLHKNAQKTYQLLLQLKNNPKFANFTRAKEAFVANFVKKWSVFSALSSDDLANVEVFLALVHTLPGSYLHDIKQASLKELKKGVNVQHNLNLWLVIFGKYSKTLSVPTDLENSVPVIMKVAAQFDSGDAIFDKTVVTIFREFSKLNTNDIVYGELESMILLTDVPAQVYKNFQVIVEVFPKEFASMVFNSQTFLDYLNENVGKLVKYYTTTSQPNSANEQLIVTILKIFELISVDESCLAVIVNSYLYLLQQLVAAGNVHVAVLSALVVVKCWNSYQVLKDSSKSVPENLDLDKSFHVFCDNVKDKSVHKYCIEGLAFLTLKVKYKREVRSNKDLVSQLCGYLSSRVEALKDKNEIVETEISDELVYGITLIVGNITSYNLILTKEEESMQYLKEYSTVKNSSKLGVAEKDSDEDITRFLQEFLHYPFVSNFNNFFKSFNKNVRDQLVKFIYNVSAQKQFRVLLVKQGALNLVIEYLIIDDANKSDAEYENYFRMFALRALAKILISSNPNLVFKKYSVLTVVPFLKQLLVDEALVNDESLVTKFLARLIKPLDIFESLLALTNLASLEDMKVKETVTTQCWFYLQNYILDTNEKIQNASLELVSNLIFCPLCATHVFNPDSAEAKRNLDILTKLVDSANIQVQINCLTVFVNGSEYEFIAQGLCKNTALFEKLINILNSFQEYLKSEDEADCNALLLRVACLLLNCACADTDSVLREDTGLKAAINRCLKSVTDEEVLAVLVEVCKQLRYI